jgi:MoaE-MoaD fusion protein
MKLTIRMYATLKERTGASLVTLDIHEPGSVTDLLEELFQRFPNLQPFKQSILVSVNQEFAGPFAQISPDDEIALFPPVSGG